METVGLWIINILCQMFQYCGQLTLVFQTVGIFHILFPLKRHSPPN